jgi:predicted ATPase/DNA-binding winged helix-turn-helix (wHTH) protein
VSEQGQNLVYESGQWQVHLGRRELVARGVAVPIGARAFEIIEVLVRAANELVTKNDLMDRIWPGAMVGENTLQVHISAIRKAFGPDRAMLKTAAGRGYRLLGNWTPRQQGSAIQPVASPPMREPGAPPANNFPLIVGRLIGRAEAARHVRDLVSAYRVVTLTGSGGIGKTTLAIEVARDLVSSFDDGGWFVELASLSDPDLVPSTVASTLGLKLSGEVSAEAVARAVGMRHLLLVFDNCEHVIDAAADLAERFVRFCPHTTIIVTSREVLRIDGEVVYRVPPLDVPALEQETPDQILSHSAVELFIARTTAMDTDRTPRTEDLASIAAVCRRLDGIPLAIEFAAASAATLGISQVASGLRDRFALLTSGRRTALPRHRTLRATLDWSYQLLTDPERRLLQHLAVFSGGFSLDAAAAVTGHGEASQAAIADGVGNLVVKSLVTADIIGGAGYHRLLETTRVYALSRLTESGELQRLSRRHAEYYRALFQKIETARESRATYLVDLDNVRAALEWCFGANGDLAIGVGLAAAIAPMFLAMSLLPECHRWSEQAILVLDDTTRGGTEELHLQAGLGISLMNAQGESESARDALNRSLTIAEQRADHFTQLGVLGILHMFHLRGGDYNAALDYARRSSAVARLAQDPGGISFGHCMVGRSLHLAGNLSEARIELEASLEYWTRPEQTSRIYLHTNHSYRGDISLARTLWLQGYPDQAVERAHKAIRDAERIDSPVALTGVLIWAASLFLWGNDLATAEAHIDRLISHAVAHSLGPNVAAGRALKSMLAIRRGDARGGVEELRGWLEKLHAARYGLLTTDCNIVLVQGLTMAGRFAEATALVNKTIELTESSGDIIYVPELLRLKGGLSLATGPRGDDAERCFEQSLELSRRMGARAWELRTATDLATLRIAQGKSESARTLLEPAFQQFQEGFDTADLKAAEHLLSTLR